MTGANVVLHIGAHKTATTHFQRTMERNAALLADAGVLFLGPRALRSGRLRLSHLIESWRPAILLRRQAAAELAHIACGYRLVVVSEENILGSVHAAAFDVRGRYYPGAARRIDRLLRVLSVRGVRLFIAIRDPAGHLVSAYSQSLFAGGPPGFARFAGSVDVAGLRWSDLIARLCRIRSVAACHVWRYEDYPACQPAVLRRMVGTSVAAAVRPVAELSQPGLSARAHAQVVAWTEAGHVAPSGTTLALEARRLFPRGEAEPVYAPLPGDLLVRSAAAYDADVARLRRMPKVDLIAPPDR